MPIVNHWLIEANKSPSPNHDARPPGTQISLIVVHCISLPPGEFGGDWIDKLFLNALPPDVHPYFATLQGLRVSAHALVRRSGDVVQYVPFDRRAWHAGESCYEGVTRCNDFSIGIELEGTVETPYAEAQYASLARLIASLLDTYPGLSAQRITGHSDVSPGRKQDPGPHFDWPKLQRLLKNLAAKRSSFL